MWDLMDFAPDEYWVRDSVVVFRDGSLFKVFAGGAVETLERTMPAQWTAEGTSEPGCAEAGRGGHGSCALCQHLAP